MTFCVVIRFFRDFGFIVCSVLLQFVILLNVSLPFSSFLQFLDSLLEVADDNVEEEVKVADAVPEPGEFL